MLTAQKVGDASRMGSQKGVSLFRPNPYDLQVYRAVQSLKKQRGTNTPITGMEIAEEADVSRNTVVRSLARLEQGGYIETSNAGGRRGLFIDLTGMPDRFQRDTDDNASSVVFVT